MEKTFGQMEETNKEVLAQTQTIPDETSTAVANLTSILEETTSSSGVRVSLYYVAHLVHNLCSEMFKILIDRSTEQYVLMIICLPLSLFHT